MKKVVISGATGAIGVALINKLVDEGVSVLALCRKEGRLDNITKSELVKIEYCSLEQMDNYEPSENDYDAFYHLAWAGTYGDARNNYVLQENNVRCAVSAVNLANRFGCKAFVGVGSQAENGVLDYGVKVRYDSPENPITEYGKAKLKVGRLTREICKKLNIRHCWCRVLSTYGECDGEHTMVMSSIKKFLNGEDVDFTPAMQDWDYIYNGDVANALYLVGLKGKNGSIYPIGSGKTHKLGEFIEIIRDCTNKNAKCNFGSLDYYDNQVMYLCADIDNLINDTGFKPSVDFKDGIKNTVEWYKKRNIVGE